MPEETRRCAIVVCHPRAESFCSHLAEHAEAAANRAGCSTIVRDLYDMAFNPVLHARDAAQSDGWRAAPDVADELILLDRPSVVVLVYPIWFGSAPALLKGYVERVLGAGHAGPGVVPSRDGIRPELLITIATSGASANWLEYQGMGSATKMFGAYLAHALGIPRSEHIALDGISKSLSQTAAAEAFASVERQVEKWIAESGNPVAHPWGALVPSEFEPPTWN